MIRNLRTLALATAACLLPFTATAGSYPDKPITLICPYSAGGGGDTASRIIAKLAGDMMGVKIIVENKTGGGATIGIGAVAKAKPDGYTIGFISTSPITIRPHMMKAPYKPLEDLSYISQFVSSSQPLVVRADSSYKTLADVIAYARANPGKLRWSTSVQRGGPHVAVEAMFKQEGVKATFVPFKGGSKVLAALLGKTIDVAMISEGSKATTDGQTRILAEGTPTRNPVNPQAPTLTEAGYPIAPAIFFGPAGANTDRGRISDCTGNLLRACRPRGLARRCACQVGQRDAQGHRQRGIQDPGQSAQVVVELRRFQSLHADSAQRLQRRQEGHR